MNLFPKLLGQHFSFRTTNRARFTILGMIVLSMFSIAILGSGAIPIANAAVQQTVDPTKPDFQLVVKCDGPSRSDAGSNYKACDFNALVEQVNILIGAAFTLGILGCVVMFSYAGYLYITGVQANISQAKKIFTNAGVGFVMMLSAWFIVYQILSWLTTNQAFKALLGK